MSPALKSAFIGLMLLGLVVTHTNADLAVLKADIDAADIALVNALVTISDLLALKYPVPKGCCDALAKLKVDIIAEINAGTNSKVTCCQAVKADVLLTIELLTVDNVLSLAKLCVPPIVDLDLYIGATIC